MTKERTAKHRLQACCGLAEMLVVVVAVKVGCDDGGICVGSPSSLRSVHDYVITVNL